MKIALGLAVAGMTILAVGSAHGAVIITEIMYNPAGVDPGTADNSSEWVELYNNGPTAVDISGWLLDDEDSGPWGAVPAGSTLEAGEAAILVSVVDAFKQTWGSGIKVFGVSWSSLANTATDTNEVLVLLDASSALVDMANYEVTTNGWPASTNGRSIYLKNVNTNNDVGANWAQSQVGVDGAYSPATAVAPFDVRDVASPGIVVPEPCSLLLFAGLTIAMLRPLRRKM